MSNMTKRDKLRELSLYIIFGVLTTLVDFVVYQGLEWVLKPRWGDHSYLFTLVVAFIAALVFGFVVNKLFVFQKKSWEPRAVVKEATTFTVTRLFSFGLGSLLTILFNDVVWDKAEPWFTPLWETWQQRAQIPLLNAMAPDEGYRLIVKWTFVAVVVVVMNYVFGKWIVFRKKESPPVQEEQEEAN